MIYQVLIPRLDTVSGVLKRNLSKMKKVLEIHDTLRPSSSLENENSLYDNFLLVESYYACESEQTDNQSFEILC